jgi:hypothetical protein
MIQEAILTLLVIDLDKHIGTPQAWRDTFRDKLSDLEIRIWPGTGNAGSYHGAFCRGPVAIAANPTGSRGDA